MKHVMRYWQRFRRWKYFLLLPGPALVWYYFLLPSRLFVDPYSTVLQSREGELLSATIAADGQWRFPSGNEVPAKFIACITAFEDKRFYSHPGVDILSLGKAFQQNVSAGKIVRGGSTLTMQVIRLSRNGKDRTFLEKMYEMILATRLELRYSKGDILKLYAAHAPFGGNVVGLEAACWRYFGRSEKELSWGEAAFLAVLPNAPSLVHPGRNRQVLLNKRNRLLKLLSVRGTIDEFTCELAMKETLPEEPVPLPRNARHLLTRAMKEGHGQKKTISTLSRSLQERVEEILGNYQRQFVGNGIHNAAAIVADVRTGQTLAYVGNVDAGALEGADVDIIRSPRSTGSILKPILYAASLDEGKILPGTLLPDVPAFISGFTPKNFTNEYDGVVPADEALIRSLNIPAVFLLKDYRYEKFHSLLQRCGMTTLNRPPEHYGLSLILGGAEGTLWDISGIYASMARTLNNYSTNLEKDKYRKTDFHPLSYIKSEVGASESTPEPHSYLNASSIFQTFEVLKELYRPGEQTGWRHFESVRKIAWKTGTSFGFRDAWAIGVTPEYVVAVWVGNADGEGRPGLTGIEAAAPVMFNIFSHLGETTWFKVPKEEVTKITVCKSSGLRNSTVCTAVDTVWVGARGLEAATCHYHRNLYLSADEKFQVNSQCASLASAHSRSWFVLPPVQEYYYKSRNLSYTSPPPFRGDCKVQVEQRNMAMIYPKSGARLFIPREVTGNAGSAVFQLAHQNSKSIVYWYLDGNYLGSTRKIHQFALNPPSGKHSLMVIDDAGNTLQQHFEVLSQL